MRFRHAALLLALIPAGCGGGADRVIVLGLDGMDPQVVDLLIAEGKLPNLARMKAEGARGPLRVADPVVISPVLWTTIATGKASDEHGIDHFVAQNPKTGELIPVTSRMRKVRAIWEIASEAGRKVGVVGWWATWPADAVNGVVVSDHTCYHFLFREGQTGGGPAGAVTHPAGLLAEIAPLVRRPADVTPEEAAPYVRVPAGDFARPFDFDDPLGHFRWALATADTYRRIGLRVLDEDRPDLLMVYVEAPDSVSHLFGHLFRAKGLAGELAEQQSRFGAAVEQTYVLADRIVGEYLAAMDRRTTLVVLSDHGFALGDLPEDPSVTRDMRRVSERFHRRDGILYLHGRGVKAGAAVGGATHLDVAPTLLALLGLPRAKDMPGRVLEEALAFERPKTEVATYETTPRNTDPAQGDSGADPEVLARLQSLGYLDARSLAPAERHQADRLFAQGRYEDAEAAFRRLVDAEPKDAGLRASLAAALASLGREDEALVQLAKATELDPLNPTAYSNRGAIYEARGQAREAVREYRDALRYEPGFAPAKAGLARLGGGPARPTARSDAEVRAAAIAEEARDAAQRGDYGRAADLLQQAERLAPRLAVVFQYQANVAYLKGDRAGAIAALRKALLLEPDNALFAGNLKALEEEAAAPRR